MTAAQLNYEVVRTAPDRVKGDLLRLWSENLLLAVKPEERFAWLYRDAPDPASAVFVLQAKTSDGSGHAVGTNGIAVRRFQLGAPKLEGRAAVSGDLAVDRSHRGLLPALQLVRAVRDFVSADFDLAYGFPNAKAAGVMLRAGFRVLGKTTRWARVLRHGSYQQRIVERLSVSPAVARLVSNEHLFGMLVPIADVARLALDVPAFVRARSSYRLEWRGSFDERFDRLWREARSEYDVVGVRSARFLGWRYPRCEIATLLRRDDGSLAAYAIVERNPHTGAAQLRDVFGEKAALAPLVDLLLPDLWWRGAVSVSVRFLGAPRLAEILKARGFARRGEQRTVVVQTGTTMESRRSRLENADRWHLFDLDEDA